MSLTVLDQAGHLVHSVTSSLAYVSTGHLHEKLPTLPSGEVDVGGHWEHSWVSILRYLFSGHEQSVMELGPGDDDEPVGHWAQVFATGSEKY